LQNGSKSPANRDEDGAPITLTTERAKDHRIA